MPSTTDKDCTKHYLPTTTGRRLQTLGLSVAAERMLRHHVYQLPMEGGYDPLAGMFPTLAPPNLPYMII